MMERSTSTYWKANSLIVAGDEVFHLRPGDFLYFDGAVLHGPERMIRLPARLLVVIGQLKAGEEA